MTLVRRYAVPVGLAMAVTTVLLFVMQALVYRGGMDLGKERRRRVLDFVRLERDSTLETRTRRRPEKIEIERPPAVPRIQTEKSDAPTQQVAKVAMPTFDPALAIAGGPSLGAAPLDTAAVPLVRVAPQYPPRAQARGVQGWVHLRFTVTAKGTIEDIEVVDADPKGYFERAARRAVAKYKYKPRVENGVAVPSTGEEIVISFELEG